MDESGSFKMILAIILLILIILLLALLIMFLFYMLFPSINQQLKIKDDPVLSVNEIKYRDSEKQEKSKVTDQRAFVLCSCNKKSFSTTKPNFNDSYTCEMVNSVYGTGTDCKFSCIGLGDCVKCCPQSAIEVSNGTAVVTNLCIGCGICVDVCPLKIIKLVPAEENVKISCAFENQDYVTCSEKENKLETAWNDKKGFKIWNYCYKIYQRIRF